MAFIIISIYGSIARCEKNRRRKTVLLPRWPNEKQEGGGGGGKGGGCMTKTSVNAHATAYAVLRGVTSAARTCRQRAAIFPLGGVFARDWSRLGAKGTGEKLSPYSLWPTRTAYGISEIVGQRAPPSHLFHRVMNSADEKRVTFWTKFFLVS